jgi:hypothetical protein
MLRYVKVLGFLLIALIVLFLTVALFMPSNYKLERSIVIKQPVEKVFENVVDLNIFNTWSYWYKEEPGAFLPIVGNIGVGQTLEWKGDKIGEGKLKITKIVPNSLIEENLQITSPFENNSKIYFKFEESDGYTTVYWGIEGELSYPIKRLMKVPMEINFNKSFNYGLSELKKLSENK